MGIHANMSLQLLQRHKVLLQNCRALLRQECVSAMSQESRTVSTSLVRRYIPLFAEIQGSFAEIQGSFAETCVRVCNVTGIADRLDQAYEDEQARQQKAKGMAGMYLYLSMFICVCIYIYDVCLYIDIQVYMSVYTRISLAYEDEHARPQKADRVAGIHLHLSMFICAGVYI